MSGKVGNESGLEKYKNMKKFEVFIYSILILLAGAWTVNTVYNALTGSYLYDFKMDKKISLLDKPPIIKLGQCSNDPKIEGIENSDEEHLTQLSKYQEICSSAVTNEIMIFTDMPKDTSVAKKNASEMAKKLKAFSEKGIKPIVIVEPVSEWGLIDFQELGDGFYDTFITTYFMELRRQGITDSELGMWVPFPEANLPYWNHANTTPSDFAKIVNRYLSLYKKEFPKAKAGILLNSATYETDDFDWANGEYISLRPYVFDIKKGLVDSFGLQGLPWAPNATIPEAASVFDPKEFLNYQLAKEAADLLGIKDVWFNTGTFGAKYTLDPEKMIKISSQKRQDLLDGILSEAIKLKKLGYNVTINIFAEDKSQGAEATDWSYLKESYTKDEGIETVFVNFITKTKNAGVGISMFDRKEEEK